MEHFNEFKKLVEQLNPDATLTQEHEAFLKETFVEISEFMQSLSEDDNLVSVSFRKVLDDEIFYYSGDRFVKLDDDRVRALDSGEVQPVVPDVIVDIAIQEK